MNEAIVRDLVAENLPRLVNGGAQGVHPEPYAALALRPEKVYLVQAPVAISQLALSPLTQILAFLVMENDSLVRLGRSLLPERPKDEAVRMAVSANAEILNFTVSRLAWLLSKLENSRNTEISPPRIGGFAGDRAYRIRAEEAVCCAFSCPARDLAFRIACCVQSIA